MTTVCPPPTFHYLPSLVLSCALEPELEPEPGPNPREEGEELGVSGEAVFKAFRPCKAQANR